MERIRQVDMGREYEFEKAAQQSYKMAPQAIMQEMMRRKAQEELKNQKEKKSFSRVSSEE